MALRLRPNCEYCDIDLPPASSLARICSYECTFCADCVQRHLHNVCPNCGGGFTPRPIRPATEWRPGLSVAKRPASTERVHLSCSKEEVAAHAQRIRGTPPEQR
ncbi:MAG: urease [Betaproteobacteria bacterium]|nr:urease [Betaproteobacteria bacterium]